MANLGTVQAKIDADLKASAESVLRDVGISPTDAINIYYKQIVYNQGIPFKLRRPRYNQETEEAIAEARRMLADPDIKTFDSVEDMLAELSQ